MPGPSGPDRRGIRRGCLTALAESPRQQRQQRQQDLVGERDEARVALDVALLAQEVAEAVAAVAQLVEARRDGAQLALAATVDAQRPSDELAAMRGIAV